MELWRRAKSGRETKKEQLGGRSEPESGCQEAKRRAYEEEQRSTMDYPERLMKMGSDLS